MNAVNSNLSRNQTGFTIIELLIATVVFSVILLVATYSVIQISRTYIRGYITSETQNTTRGIVDQIGQQIQLSAAGTISIPSASPDNGVYWFCVNGQRYVYTYDLELSTAHGSGDVFVQDLDPGGCVDPGPGFLSNPGAGSKELLSQDMQLVPPTSAATPASIISQVNASGGTGLFSLSINIVYGDDSPPGTGAYLIDSTSGTRYCAGISSGGAFCAVSDITTTVQQRTAGF